MLKPPPTVYLHINLVVSNVRFDKNIRFVQIIENDVQNGHFHRITVLPKNNDTDCIFVNHKDINERVYTLTFMTEMCDS